MSSNETAIVMVLMLACPYRCCLSFSIFVSCSNNFEEIAISVERDFWQETQTPLLICEIFQTCSHSEATEERGFPRIRGRKSFACDGILTCSLAKLTPVWNDNSSQWSQDKRVFTFIPFRFHRWSMQSLKQFTRQRKYTRSLSVMRRKNKSFSA